MSFEKSGFWSALASQTLRALCWYAIALISASNAEGFGVQMHYYRLPMWPVMCVKIKCDGPTNAWVVLCLSWKTISVPWFGRDNSTQTANNAKYSNCKRLQEVESRDLWRQPIKFAARKIDGLPKASMAGLQVINRTRIHVIGSGKSPHKFGGNVSELLFCFGRYITIHAVV